MVQRLKTETRSKLFFFSHVRTERVVWTPGTNKLDHITEINCTTARNSIWTLYGTKFLSFPPKLDNMCGPIVQDRIICQIIRGLLFEYRIHDSPETVERDYLSLLGIKCCIGVSYCFTVFCPILSRDLIFLHSTIYIRRGFVTIFDTGLPILFLNMVSKQAFLLHQIVYFSSVYFIFPPSRPRFISFNNFSFLFIVNNILLVIIF